MLIRNHPELIQWNPDNGVAYPPPFPTVKVISHLIVQAIIYKKPSRIEFILAYWPGKCVVIKDFKDKAFAAALYQSRHKCIGLPLAIIGGINIEYRRSRSCFLSELF
jgi:hypothetical protein